MSEPDLFVVCKNCSSEVSPYVTECPYCGQRLRKRAPRLDRNGVIEEEAPPKKRREVPALPRLRRGEIPGIAPEVRPYATIALIALSLLATVAQASRVVSLLDLGALTLPFGGDVWRLVTTFFLYANTGYQFVALLAVGIFGTLLERRFGPWTVLAVFFLAGTAGAAAAAVVPTFPVVLGANGAALGLVCAWLVDDRRASARGEDRESDRLGVYVVLALLVGLSLADETASIVAAVVGAAVGALFGFVIATFRR